MLSSLNVEQQKAMKHYQGPLLIVAGPGTGKTTVLTHHLTYLIEKKKVSPSQILAVTFTNKAAQEMEERVDQLLPVSCFDLRIGTFHSLGEEILREHGLEIGLPVNFKVLDEKGSWLMMRQFWNRFDLPYYQPLGDPGQLISALLVHFSRCKDEGITPEDYHRYFEKFKKKEKDAGEIQRVKNIIQAYRTYQKLLLENNCFDFGDLINYSCLLLEKRPKISKAYQQRWPFILIDEFQDTNWSQYKLIKLLARPKNNLTVCASGDQAIYQWRGASFSNVLQFLNDYSQAKVVVLKKNYRSGQKILDLSYNFIQLNNPNRLEFQFNQKNKRRKIDNQLKAVKKNKTIIQAFHFSTWLEEASGVSQKIQKLLSKVSPNEIAVLARTHQTLRPFEEALKRSGISCQVLSSEGIYYQTLILDLLAYLRVLNNRFDDSSFYRVMNLPFWKIKASTLSQLVHYHQQKGQCFFQNLKMKGFPLEVIEKAKVKNFLSCLEKHAEMIREKKISEVLILILEETGWLKWLVGQKEEKELSQLNQFFKKVKEFEQNATNGRLNDFLLQVEMEREAGKPGEPGLDIEEGPESIKVMTVHAAKGLEFKYVFLVGLISQRFPSQQRGDLIPFPVALIKEKIPQGDQHLQEERRLFYVAMTRAKEGLFFTWADDYGGKSRRKPSRFLQELGVSPINPQAVPEKQQSQKKLRRRKEDKVLLPERFSFTQLKNFQTCPRQYKFTHLLKLPARGGASRSFGQTIHKTLETFLRNYNLDSRFQPDWSHLLRIYQEAWISDWYRDEKQEKDYFQDGKRQLKIFFRDFKKHPPQIYQQNNQPFLEKSFEFTLSGYPFRGKIDRVDALGEGVEIIDYKTGKPSQKLNTDHKKQLLIYQIAAEEVFHLHPLKLTFCFLKDGTRLSFLGGAEEKQKAKQEIVEDIKKIKKSSFAAQPGYHCRYCDYRNICENY